MLLLFQMALYEVPRIEVPYPEEANSACEGCELVQACMGAIGADASEANVYRQIGQAESASGMSGGRSSDFEMAGGLAQRQREKAATLVGVTSKCDGETRTLKSLGRKVCGSSREGQVNLAQSARRYQTVGIEVLARYHTLVQADLIPKPHSNSE